MKNAVLVHGWATKEEFDDAQYPTPSNSHWFPWLTKQLMIKGIHTVAPEMPDSYYPEYFLWKKEFERFDIGSETILVGHSCGGGFLIRWLSENKDVEVGKVILVAPWVGTSPGQDFDKSFFEFEWDDNLADRTAGLTMFSSKNDAGPVQESMKIVRKRLNNLKEIIFEDKGHFTLGSMGTEAFPKLLEVCAS